MKKTNHGAVRTFALSLGGLCLGLGSLGCAADDDSTTPAPDRAALIELDETDDEGIQEFRAAKTGAYRVEIKNLTKNQWLTPPVVAAHTSRIALFREGYPAPAGVREIAENGNLDPLLAALSESSDVADFEVGLAGDPPPLAPKASVTVELEAHPLSRLSMAAMLICTNDGFTGLDSAALPFRVGRTSTYYLYGYDAGSELNTEDFADIVPPCQALSGVSSDDPGTGASNPDLAENGVVEVHPGIDGTLEDSDLTVADHGFRQPVAVIRVTRMARYEVTVTNTTATQPLTPPVAAIHDRRMNVFQPGYEASEGVREIAENGNLAPLVDSLGASPAVADVVVAAGDPPPILPGTSRTFQITSNRLAHRLSVVSMLICTNDGFTGVNALQLPYRIGGTKEAYGFGYDAGSEINTEDFADIVPPCQGLSGVSSDDDGTGASNPDLAENSVIGMHPGVSGDLPDGDLTTEEHGWDTDAPTMNIQVTRVQ